MRLIVHLQHVLHRQLCVALRGCEAFVAKQLLDGAQIGTFFQHVRAEGMAQSVWVHVGREAFGYSNFLDDAADAARSQATAAMVDQQRRQVLAWSIENSLPLGEICCESGP